MLCSRRSAPGPIIAFCFATAAAHGEVLYSIFDLGGLEVGGWVNGLNNKGQVVGGHYTRVNGVGRNHAFRTAPNSAINWLTDDLGTLGAVTGAAAIGVNDLGQVVGMSGIVGGFGTSPFRTAPNSPINPETDDLGGTLAVAQEINDAGQVAGYYTDTKSWKTRAVRTAPDGRFTDPDSYLGTLGGRDSYALGINQGGQITGRSSISSGAEHAYRTGANQVINPATDGLGTLGGTFSAGIAINDSGQVVGYAALSGDASHHAFLTSPSGTVGDPGADMGTLGGASSYGYDVNEDGVAVGSSQVAEDASTWHAFVYFGSGDLLDLNDLIDPSSAWVLTDARAINNHGQIAGIGYLEGERHGFLLTPVPEPATLALLTVTGCVGMRRRRTA